MELEAFSLREKVALVVGVANPVGRATALALAEAGAQVAVATTLPTQREQAAAHACAQDIRALQRQGFAHTLDTTSAEAVEALIQRTVTTLGPLEILVNAQDLPFAKPLSDTSPAEWKRVLEVHLTGVYLTCRAASTPMLTRGKGRIINVVSLLGERGMAHGSAYCAAQAGVLNLTRALALEWARAGITVNAIGAGWTEGMGFLENDSLRQQLVRYLPSKRLAQPREIGDLVVYLAADASAFLTGQVLWVDGGVLSRL
jgi:NAD(P)-dependent dehydrogenase (short-subunit alcohol dehydrogenase family)